jgi:tyrosinase
MMLLHSSLLLCLFIVLFSAQLSSANKGRVDQSRKCSQLLERKEWRTLTRKEKAEWVGAVKVRLGPLILLRLDVRS